VPAAIFKVTAKRQRTHTKTLHDDNGIGVGINSNPALGQSRRIQVPTLSASRVKTRRLLAVFLKFLSSCAQLAPGVGMSVSNMQSIPWREINREFHPEPRTHVRNTNRQ
jgi:hypothetical protein